MDKSKGLRLKSKGLRLKSKRSSRRRLPPIQSGDQIDYRNMSLISRFISDQGKILSRRVTRLTLKQQRFITVAIKQARILSFLPFVNNDLYNKTKTTTKNKNKKQFQRRESTTRTRGLEPKRKKNKPYFRTH